MQTRDNHFSRLERLFNKVVDLEPAAREKVFEEESALDPVLVNEVKALIMMDRSNLPSNMTKAIDAAKTASMQGPGEELIGQTVGDYKLISIIGRGGSGTVYLGERVNKKFTLRVAIKVIGTALLNSFMLSGFSSEQEILSSLNHPNIARLLDAGESEDGYPFLVMEYVHGVRIDSYCEEKSLSIEERLKLFLRICTAVQYAHQNLVVHRDLKPANILVSDGGDPKLLDFGIAKLLAANDLSAALTRLNDRALTPDYASPEQIAGRPIMTTSDVYSLGVILYELLSGLRPYIVDNNNQLELERCICIVDPPKPSTAVSRAKDPSASQHPIASAAAAARGLTLKRLQDVLTGDLDAIVMRALRKEPEKRYASVEAFAADIQRYLKAEPVEARHGNWMYYSARFYKRHTVPVIATGVLGVALIIFSITSALLYHRARIDRDHAERVSNLMSAVFQDANPYESQGHEVTALELLDSASQRVGEVKDDPEVHLRLLTQMGSAYLNLGHYDTAATQLSTAVKIQRRLHPKDTAALARLLVRLASAERGAGKLDAAEHDFIEAKQLLVSMPIPNEREYADLLRAMGRLEHNRGELKSAEKYYLDSIAIGRRLDGESLDVAVSLRELAALYNWMNNLGAAENAGREALTIFEHAVPEQHPDRVLALFALGNILLEHGQINDAAPMIERSVTAQRTIYHNTGPILAQSLSVLAQIKESQGKFAEAEALLRESLADSERSLGEHHFQSSYYRTSLGKFLVETGRFDEAEQQLRKALVIYAETLPKEHQYVASALYWLGEALIGAHHAADAVEVLTNARDIGQQSKAPTWLIARTESALGQALADAGDRTRASRYLSSSYELLKKERGAEDAATRRAQQRLQDYQRRRR